MCKESLHLPLQTVPAVILVLSGQVTTRSGRSCGAGEAFVPEGDDLRGDARLWLVKGQTGLVSSLERFSAQLTRKDAATAAHSARVAQLAVAIGCYLRLSKARLERLGLAAYLHDLGKLTLSTTLLQTPKPLTPYEWELMKRHPSAGKQLLEMTPLAFSGVFIEQHHERFDGSGYPFGLRGNEIGLESYIVAVADTFDAMTHDRPYRRAQSRQRAFAEINRYSEIFYPRKVVAAFNALTNNAGANSTVSAVSAQVVR